jgi:hypothetical protein
MSGIGTGGGRANDAAGQDRLCLGGDRRSGRDPVGLSGSLDPFGREGESGEFGEQRRGLGERHGRPGAGGHRLQSG